jgi:pimeloyl-ACP methyl ester carboxylesterase
MMAARVGWLADPKVAAEHQATMRAAMIKGVDKLAVPTLLVRGGSSDVVTREAAAALLQMLPHARFVDVADASHMVAGDRNDAFSAAVLEFASPLIQENRPPMNPR